MIRGSTPHQRIRAHVRGVKDMILPGARARVRARIARSTGEWQAAAYTDAPSGLTRMGINTTLTTPDPYACAVAQMRFNRRACVRARARVSTRNAIRQQATQTLLKSHLRYGDRNIFDAASTTDPCAHVRAASVI
jgi:hypothetical protein